MPSVDVVENGRGKFAVDISVGPHALIADEPAELGGNDYGPSPHDFLLAGLGACTSMTLRMYADRKSIPLEQVRVRLTRRKIKAADCPDCVTKEGEVEEMTREITLVGDLDEATRQRLLEIANKCPVHRTLLGEIKIRTALMAVQADTLGGTDRMRAMVMDRFGGPEVLHMADVERPKPAPGEVLIRVAYASVNPADWKCREGWLSRYFQYTFPFIVGFDAAGVVAEVGQGVTDYKVGDRVVTSSNLGEGEWGTYAEYVKSSTIRVAHLADSVDFKTAATIPTAAITSWEGLFDTGHLKAGQTVLVHGGAGGCGSFAIQFAKHVGARIAATCGPANMEYVRELGAERAINYRAENVLEAVRAWAPDGVDLVLDTVGQGTLKDGIKMVKRGGVLGYIATLIENEPMFDAEEAKKQGVNLAFVMSNRDRSGRQMTDIVNLFNQGKLRAPSYEVLPLDQAGEAQKQVQAGHVRGKLLLKVAEI